MDEVVVLNMGESFRGLRWFPVERCVGGVTGEGAGDVFTQFELVGRGDDSVPSEDLPQVLRLVDEFGRVGFAEWEGVVGVGQLGLRGRHLHSLIQSSSIIVIIKSIITALN